jgi:1-acyl-sn-glycerol-3-phosphate acyltransferase
MFLATRPIKECGLYEFPFVNLRLLGTSYKFENVERVPKNVPIIFVSNHQSMYDIIAMIWFFRFHCKFVSKRVRERYSKYFNLRHGGSALIDRKDPTRFLLLKG